jgi:mannose-6-phosphate isomerase-like protein (cupin superfamily)
VKKLASGILLGLLASVAVLKAQQPISNKVVQPQILLNTDKYIVQRYVLKPGEGTPVHPHNLEHVAIIIHGSTIRYRDINGKVTEAVMKSDTAKVVEPKPAHSFMNIGTTTYEEVSVEVKH